MKTLIKNARIHDSIHREPFDGDILIEDGKMPKAVADTAKDSIRALLDTMVAKTMSEKAYKYTTASGKDPIKYAQVFADAVSSALTDKDFQKGYEEVATYFALASLVESVKDEIKKEYEIFKEDVDSDFDASFAKLYPELAKNYIDTLSEVSSMTEAPADFDPWGWYFIPAVGAVS